MKVLKNIGAVALCIVSFPFAIIAGLLVGIGYTFVMLIQVPVLAVESIWEETHHE